MKLSHKEKLEIDYWDKKSAKETFESLDWVGVKERNDFFKFAGLSGDLRVLEIGAGTGRWTIPLLEKGFNVTATDISTKSLKILQEKAKKAKVSDNLTILDDNFEKSAFDQKFDAVFCFGVIHHFDSLKREIIMTNIIKALKKNGKIYILEPNPLNFLYYWIYWWRFILNKKGENRWNTEKGFLRSTIWELKKLLKRLGVVKVKNQWYGYLPSRFAKYCPFVLEFNKLFNNIPVLRLFSAYIWIKGIKNGKKD